MKGGMQAVVGFKPLCEMWAECRMKIERKLLQIWLLCAVALLLSPAVVQAQFGSGSGDGFIYSIDNRTTITITNYTGPTGAVTIPSNINNLTVNGIGNGISTVFSKNTPTSVLIASSIISIGAFAFANCTNLTNIIIPSSITSIGAFAFADCTKLTNIIIPSGVTSIGRVPFQNCLSLTGITVNPQNLFFSSSNGVSFDENQTTLIQYPCGLAGNYSIPSSVTNVAIGAFEFCALLNMVTIPNSVTSIEDGAFFDCTSLTDITIPSSVTILAETAFYGCSSLTNVTIPSSVTDMGFEAFGLCGDLSSVTLQDGITSIAGDAFFCCTSLTNVTIPASVTSIGELAFEDCVNLTNVYFLGEAPTVDSTVFASNTNATVYYLPGTTGWQNFSSIANVPAVLWNPLIQTTDGSFGISNSQYGFNITGSNNFTVVVEACTNLSSPAWLPLQTVTLTNGVYYFSDPQWTNYLCRYYSLGMP